MPGREKRRSSASDEGERPPLPTEPIITLSCAEARLLREVYLLDNWDAPVEDVDRARQILERLSAEADARIEALMRWDAERQQQAYEERQRQVKSEDS